MNLGNIKLNWRLGIILIFILFSILYGLFLFLFPPKKNTPQTQPNILSPSPTPSKKWQTYQTKDYQVEYPNDWIAQEYKTTSGTTLLIKPSTLPKELDDPSITIEELVGLDTILDLRKKFYIKKGFKEKNILIGRQNAIKLFGTSPIKVVGTKPVKSPIQETNIFFKKANLSYVIRYHYDGETLDADMEDLFDEIISSLKFIN